MITHISDNQSHLGQLKMRGHDYYILQKQSPSKYRAGIMRPKETCSNSPMNEAKIFQFFLQLVFISYSIFEILLTNLWLSILHF